MTKVTIIKPDITKKENEENFKKALEVVQKIAESLE